MPSIKTIAPSGLPVQQLTTLPVSSETVPSSPPCSLGICWASALAPCFPLAFKALHPLGVHGHSVSEAELAFHGAKQSWAASLAKRSCIAGQELGERQRMIIMATLVYCLRVSKHFNVNQHFSDPQTTLWWWTSLCPFVDEQALASSSALPSHTARER